MAGSCPFREVCPPPSLDKNRFVVRARLFGVHRFGTSLIAPVRNSCASRHPSSPLQDRAGEACFATSQERLRRSDTGSRVLPIRTGWRAVRIGNPNNQFRKSWVPGEPSKPVYRRKTWRISRFILHSRLIRRAGPGIRPASGGKGRSAEAKNRRNRGRETVVLVAARDMGRALFDVVGGIAHGDGEAAPAEHQDVGG